MASDETVTWRVECEGGAVRGVDVRRYVATLAGRTVDRYEATPSGTAFAGCSRPTARDAALAVACFESWPAVAVLAPGAGTRAELERERDEALRLLGEAAAGKIPKCRCGRLATRQWHGDGELNCDSCFDEDKRGCEQRGMWDAGDEAACEDLPYAAALRAALGGAR